MSTEHLKLGEICREKKTVDLAERKEKKKKRETPQRMGGEKKGRGECP